jgi:hypothetical protein
MQKMFPHPWTPVRVPKVQAARRQATSLGGLAALEKLQKREQELIHINRLRAIGGCAAVLISCALMPFFAEWIFRISGNLRPKGAGTVPDPRQFGLVLDGLLLIVTIPMAIAVSQRSRSRMVNEFLDTGMRPSGTRDNPLIRLGAMVVMLGFLYGEFLIVDAIRFLLLCIRLRNVDRFRAALVLAKLFAEPAGIDPRALLEVGENPLHLRQILGYLMAYEWADISPQGDWLGALSPSKRELRHASNGLFEAG